MSWLSKTVDKARKFTDKVGNEITKPMPSGLRSFSRKAFRYGTASMAGGMGLQYEYSRNKGMNSDEATKNATTGGAQYSEAREMQKARVAEEKEKIAFRDALAEQERERDKARDAIAVRVRRSGVDRRTNRMGAVPGGLGTAGSARGTFATLLGL